MKCKTLEEYRLQKKLTQTQLAKELGIAVSTYNQYVSGKRKMPVTIKEKVCYVLDISEENVINIFLPASFTISKSLQDKKSYKRIS